MKIVIATGGFDPLHSGHISYLNHADHLGDWLVVGLNSDAWLTRKKGRPFMSWHERMTVLDNLHMVDRIIEFDDSDGTACDAIQQVQKMFPGDKIVFANGGDRTKENIPEMVERLKYDILYIENMTIALDLKILIYTFLIVLQGRGK
jgi:cytidyltransferase-like protein